MYVGQVGLCFISNRSKGKIKILLVATYETGQVGESLSKVFSFALNLLESFQ